MSRPSWRYTCAIRLEIVVGGCPYVGCPNHTPARLEIELAALTSALMVATAEGQPLSGAWS
ncbi:MAG TPA: hypothetical protein VJU58_13765 [Microbacterium sp.]|nr:hypothetical protein [Microbacterium sp.]